jgi:hypothetical protein
MDMRRLFSVVSMLCLAIHSVSAESLHDYAEACLKATGVDVPAFNCDDPASTLVPTTHTFDRNGNPLTVTAGSDFVALYKQLRAGSGGRCDRPDQLNQECDPGSRFRVLVNTADAFVVAHCRKKGNPGNTWGDIAAIQHNRKNGATCFYQEGPRDGLPNAVTAPRVADGNWNSPAGTHSEVCVGCHDNGPIIRSPYLAQITGQNRLPGAGDRTFNSRGSPYSFVGKDFADWRAYSVEVPNNFCISCHRLGVNIHSQSSGTAMDFAIRATQEMPTRGKNPHSADSPLWMLPGQASFSAPNFASAQQIQSCGQQFRVGSPLPNSPSCKITQYAGPYDAGFGNLLDGKHPIWIGDFTGSGQTQVLFYYSADGHWWLGDFKSGVSIEWSLVSESAGFGNLLDGKHPIWIGDYTHSGHQQVLFYYSGDGNWWLGDMTAGQMAWTLVGNTAGFGNLLDGKHPIWFGDFGGVGRTQVMFHYSTDGNWWLGDLQGGQLKWTLVNNSLGFGNLLDGKHPIWIGDYTHSGHQQVLFYYSGDGNWWLGDVTAGQMAWKLAGNTTGFGNLLDGKHPMWFGDFAGVGRTQVLFYYSSDGNWWLGDLQGGQLKWTLVNNSTGFGNLLDGNHPIWIGDFAGVGRKQVMFYYSSDGNWWLGDLQAGQLKWTLVNNSTGFGNLIDSKHRISFGNFTGANRTQVMFYSSGDGNWWLGDVQNGQLTWSLVNHSAGFGNLLDGQHPLWFGDFTNARRTQLLFYYTGDGHWWLGDVQSGQLLWRLSSETGP